MRVLVELFDQEPIENVLSSCVFLPDTVVYLCDERDSAFIKESGIYRLFKRRKMKTQPRFYYFDATDPAGIRQVLQAVVWDYPGCVFDFTGGRDLVLLVAGACFAEMQLPGFYIDVQRERFINLRGCEHLAHQFYIPQFTAEDIFAMTGATVHGYGHFAAQEMTGAFQREALAVFDVVLKNPRAWGDFVSYLQGLSSGTPANALTVRGQRRIKTGNGSIKVNPVLLGHLQRTGAISHYALHHNEVELTYQSALHRKCLLIEGIWLELYCYIMARHSGFFGDVHTSVVVDWDGVDGNGNSTKNEVDVLLVRGIIPVFISCKMSLPSALALSEIRLLATKFGGRESRAVLLTAGSLTDNNRALRARAMDLNISIIDRQVLEQGQLIEELKSIAGIPVDEPRLMDFDMMPARKRGRLKNDNVDTI